VNDWGTTVTYQLAIERHRADLAQGEAMRQLADLPQRSSLRARLANALVSLAARLDPIAAASRQSTPATSAAPA
jgi:hypothetical protein